MSRPDGAPGCLLNSMSYTITLLLEGSRSLVFDAVLTSTLLII